MGDAPVSASQLVAAVDARKAEILGKLETMTMKQLRALLESDLGLAAGALKPLKDAVKAAVDDLIKRQQAAEAAEKAKANSPAGTSDDDAGADSDGSTPPRKKKAPAKPVAKKKPAKASSSGGGGGGGGGGGKKTYGPAVERLKAVARAATITIAPTVYVKAKGDEDALVEAIEGVLASHGLHASSDSAAIARVKKKLTLARELDGIDTSNIIADDEKGGGRGGRARPTRGGRVNYAAALAEPRLPGDSEDEEGDEDEDGDSSSSDDEPSSSGSDSEGGGGKAAAKQKKAGPAAKAKKAKAATPSDEDDDDDDDSEPSSSPASDSEPEASSDSSGDEEEEEEEKPKAKKSKKAVLSSDEEW